MKIKIERTIIDDETFEPTLVLKVLLDADQTIKLIQENGRDDASQILGEMFFDALEKEL